ncbi:MAG: hypothetical protein ACI8T1_004803 [Verrucomicrobiales bacterium]|jgi:hypothetical protein
MATSKSAGHFIEIKQSLDPMVGEEDVVTLKEPSLFMSSFKSWAGAQVLTRNPPEPVIGPGFVLEPESEPPPSFFVGLESRP